jgi:hypothetical protein
MTPSYPAVSSLGWLSLALGSALLREARDRRIAAAGMVSLALGLAAWRVSSPGQGALAAPGLGQGFLAVNGGLLVLGLGLVAWAAVRDGYGLPRIPPKVGIVVGLVLVGRLCAELLIAGGVIRVVASAVALGCAGSVLIVGGRAIASSRPAATLGRRIFGEPLRPHIPADRKERWLAGATAAGAVAVAAGPHLAVVFLGAILAAWSGFFLSRPRGSHPAPLAPALVLVLVPTYWLLATIAGPIGLGVGALRFIPLSPAAESLVAPALLLAGWGIAGLWPLHRQMPGALLGPIGALLLLRIGHPLVPGGLEQWQPLAIPVLAVGIWHAAARNRWPLLAMGAGLLGTVELVPVGAAGAAWLVGAGFLLEISAMRPPSGAGVTGAITALAWIASAWGGLLVLEGGLRSEVVYTAFGAAGLALIVAASGRPVTHSEGSSAREGQSSSTAPSCT